MKHVLDRNIHREPRLSLEMEGAHEIFRFAVNMLDDQVEFCAAGRAIIVELREVVGEKFDPWAEMILGAGRYKKLAPYFLRDSHCLVCERDIPAGEPFEKASNAQAVCAGCAVGDPS
jgi:hypothetical protein